MSRPGAAPRLWDSGQLSVVLALLVGIALYLGVRLLIHSDFVSDPQPPWPLRAGELEDRIDPNSAAWHTIAALPGIGEKRAKDIVAYREQFLTEHPGGLAFARAEDLLRIRGVGPAMLSQIEPYLIFPAIAPKPATTQSNADQQHHQPEDGMPRQ